MSELISGGISGGITDPTSPRALSHAEMYYNEIRHMTSDVKKISENVGIDLQTVVRVKNYLFYDIHVLDNDRIGRFDPSFEIAESWRRLAFDPIHLKKHDKLLIPHEILEIKLKDAGYSHDEAHYIASQSYDYPGESTKYYDSLLSLEELKKKDKTQNKSLKNIGEIELW